MGGRRGRARGSHGAWVICSLIYSTLHISELPGLAWKRALGRGGTDRTLAPAVFWARGGSQEGFLEETMPELNPVLFSQREMCPGRVCKRRKAEAALPEAGLGLQATHRLPAPVQAPESTDPGCLLPKAHQQLTLGGCGLFLLSLPHAPSSIHIVGYGPLVGCKIDVVGTEQHLKTREQNEIDASVIHVTNLALCLESSV